TAHSPRRRSPRTAKLSQPETYRPDARARQSVPRKAATRGHAWERRRAVAGDCAADIGRIAARPTSVDFLIASPYNLARSGAGAVNPDARWKPRQRRQRPNQRPMHGRRDPFRMWFGMARAHLGAAALA